MGKEINLKHSSWLIKKIVPIKQIDIDSKIVSMTGCYIRWFQRFTFNT